MLVEVRQALQPSKEAEDEEEGRPLGEGINTARQRRDVALCVVVYTWFEHGKPGIPTRDWVWWSGFVATAVQLGISAIPFSLSNDWPIFLITACSTILSYASGSLPQWRKEKWHARNRKKDVALTLGNGSQHVIIVLGAGGALDLEDLAGGRTVDLLSTKLSTFALAIFWLVLLIKSTGIKTNTWYLLAVGGLGMLHNLMVARAPGYPASLGLPIELAKINTTETKGRERQTVAIFAERKVMWTLMELEDKYPNFGKSLLKEFFPGELRDWERIWWSLSDQVERRNLLVEKQKECDTKIHPFY